MNEDSIVVIGAGIIGICSALWLQRAGAKVVIIEQTEVGRGSSFGNAGCLNVSSVVPVSMPGILRKVPGYLMDPCGPLVIRPSYAHKIAPWLWRFVKAGTHEGVTAQAAALRNMLWESFDSYQPLTKGTSVQELMKHQGHLIVYRSEADYADDALAWRLRRENGVVYEELRGSALREREPALASDVALGIFLHQNGHVVDPFQFVKGLSEIFLSAGGEILNGRATGFDFKGNRLNSVITEGRAVLARKAVIACGAHSLLLTKGLGDVIPLDTERGYHVMIRDPEVMPRVPTTDASGKYVLTPMRDGLRIAGTVEFAGLDRKPDYRRATMLVAQAQQILPDLAKKYPDGRMSLWMGCRPSMPDSLPVIGPSRKTSDVIYAFGHGHVGMAGGSRTGMLVRDLALGLPLSMPAEPFSSRRFDKS